ncbi:MAG: CinA family protein [Alphaproteobacteria bacterium]
MTLPDTLLHPASRLLEICADASLTLAVAESCTGGMISACLTAIPGSSRVVDRGFVTYSNAAKTEMLGVPEPLLQAHGAVSEAVARAMVEGILRVCPVNLALSVTGIAGPDGGSENKPVGLVHMAACLRQQTPLHRRFLFPGDRTAVREAAALEVMTLAIRLLERSTA